MKVVHTTMIRCGSDIPTTYEASILDCRWINKNRGKWKAKFVSGTGHFITKPCEVSYVDKAVQAECDALSRKLAAELGIKAGPDFFPY